ncbi:regulator of G protein signaling superfamily [Hesseltinella vesiculosa]|uniref:Regulator of G protein signaling superfamily n=1 Tax=Hesseltinella vesiculosa TaxID=101127 RepID=A0A1X2GSE6_9FUNG|nr:regulator of G protein signaling superfamily [Hesseltinella vesiculosa]
MQRSSSISSITSSVVSKINPDHTFPISIDTQTMYKVRRRHSSGDIIQAPHRSYLAKIAQDVCLQEIQQNGLTSLLSSKVPLCYFLYHLLQEYSYENLFFYLELEQYDKILSDAQKWTTAKHVYETYVSKNSHFEVNLDDQVRSDIIAAMEARRLDRCFDKAKRAVYLLLEYSFMQFMQASTWEIMVSSCGKAEKK